MPNSEKLSPRKKVFIDYKPAELKTNQDWLIVYYAKMPGKAELKRFRKRVPKISPYKERLKYGKKMALAINKKLENGWSPFYEKTEFGYKSIDYCFDFYIKIQEKEIKDGIKRPDTLRSYKSCIKLIQEFKKRCFPELKFIIEIDVIFINSYLDYVYYERNNSPRTFNNHLRFLRTFLDWCKSKSYVNQNATEGIKSKPKQKKKREVLSNNIKEKVKELRKTDFHYFVLCMCTYYMFIRRTELTKLKVSDVNLMKGYITIDGSNSKNKKTENVTIPNIFLGDLALHLSKSNNSDFLFSADDFKAGKKQLDPKKISDVWAKFRRKNKFENKYQFYSLKDTGITDLLNSGIPAIKVRDQARHYDLSITESYTARNQFADESVQKANFEF